MLLNRLSASGLAILLSTVRSRATPCKIKERKGKETHKHQYYNYYPLAATILRGQGNRAGAPVPASCVSP